ncbi:MAG: hypothetical protein QXR57_00045 [Metallosphaera sp.]|uniref:hypothetical protein n=1 Tax=Metallosphaera TaxID=41980 RepID=UPI000A079824|nr:hypothetical protein [Metallosphaera cuprina]
MNTKFVVLLTVIGVLFFIVLSIPMNIFSSLLLGVGSAIEIAVAVYIILMSGLFILVFRRFNS